MKGLGFRSKCIAPHLRELKPQIGQKKDLAMRNTTDVCIITLSFDNT